MPQASADSELDRSLQRLHTDHVELYQLQHVTRLEEVEMIFSDDGAMKTFEKAQKDGMVCMSIDGQIKWKTGRSPLFDKGGSILADGLLLSVDGSTTLYLIEPDPSGFKPLASAVLLERGENWAPIALADGKLLIRDQRQLKCLIVTQ